MTSAITKKSVVAMALSRISSDAIAEALWLAANTEDGKAAIVGLAEKVVSSSADLEPTGKTELATEIVALCSIVTTDDERLAAQSWMYAVYSKRALSICLAVAADTVQGSRALLDSLSGDCSENVRDAICIALGKRWILARDADGITL